MSKIRIINRDNTSTPMNMTSDVGTGDTSTTPMIRTGDTITTQVVETVKQLQQDRSFGIYIVIICLIIIITGILMWCFRKKIRVCWDNIIAQVIWLCYILRKLKHRPAYMPCLLFTATLCHDNTVIHHIVRYYNRLYK